MRVGIVTLPLHFNYGGILQAFALQKVIKDLGYDPFIVNKPANNFRQIVKRILYKKSGIYGFIKRSLVFLELKEPCSFNELTANKVLTLVVGSDQVWRPCMGANREDNINRYFLRTDKENCIKKISYAASFGVDYWDFTMAETDVAKKLVNDFSFVSVRETSGIALCSQYLDINAVQVLDPTLLIELEIYKGIMEKTPFKTTKSHCFIYLLDYDSITNEKMVNLLLPDDVELYSAKVERSFIKKMIDTENTIEKWLSAIYNSDLVITDSFHGCVFSILFHKKFYVMENTMGGNTRIHSLLSLFGLDGRLVNNNSILSEIPIINWENVEQKLQELKQYSITYLQKALKQ